MYNNVFSLLYLILPYFILYTIVLLLFVSIEYSGIKYIVKCRVPSFLPYTSILYTTVLYTIPLLFALLFLMLFNNLPHLFS